MTQHDDKTVTEHSSEEVADLGPRMQIDASGIDAQRDLPVNEDALMDSLEGEGDIKQELEPNGQGSQESTGNASQGGTPVNQAAGGFLGGIYQRLMKR